MVNFLYTKTKEFIEITPSNHPRKEIILIFRFLRVSLSLFRLLFTLSASSASSPRSEFSAFVSAIGLSSSLISFDSFAPLPHSATTPPYFLPYPLSFPLPEPSSHQTPPPFLLSPSPPPFSSPLFPNPHLPSTVSFTSLPQPPPHLSLHS